MPASVAQSDACPTGDQAVAALILPCPTGDQAVAGLILPCPTGDLPCPTTFFCGD